jgi:succinate dehydrogenase/fumarate reductase flavoprotein subunit
MTTWNEYLQNEGTLAAWPYPILYGKVNEVSCDVLVLGGGIAGSHAAINAARKGVKVAVVEKGHTKWSGAGGTGVDHWHSACTSPVSNVTPVQYTKAIIDAVNGYTCGPARFIDAMESWDAVLDLEGMGMQIRDVEDEFKGAEFRDDKTKLLFAYCYDSKYTVRVWGANNKPALQKECKRLGVKIFDRVMVNSLLTEGGKQGGKVIGATGVNTRTGEFYIFKKKATILSMATAGRNWIFSTELSGFTDQTRNISGDGHAMAWKAGAEFAAVEQSRSGGAGPYGYPPYSTGNAGQTWYPCTIVDANGKEIPWVDRDGKILKTVSERSRLAPGQKF